MAMQHAPPRQAQVINIHRGADRLSRSDVSGPHGPRHGHARDRRRQHASCCDDPARAEGGAAIAPLYRGEGAIESRTAEPLEDTPARGRRPPPLPSSLQDGASTTPSEAHFPARREVPSPTSRGAFDFLSLAERVKRGLGRRLHPSWRINDEGEPISEKWGTEESSSVTFGALWQDEARNPTCEHGHKDEGWISKGAKSAYNRRDLSSSPVGCGQPWSHFDCTEDNIADLEESTADSISERFEGKLADLTKDDVHSRYASNDDSDGEGGVVIMGETTEEEHDESMREYHLDNCRRLLTCQRIISGSIAARPRLEPGWPPALEREGCEPIFHAAPTAADSDATIATNGSASLYKKLPKGADKNSTLHAIVPRAEKETAMNGNEGGGVNSSGLERYHGPTGQSHDPQYPKSQRPPVRLSRLCQDRYLAEIDILPSNCANPGVVIANVLDIMANMDLLHLWFDPVPAVFDATVVGGSGSRSDSFKTPHSIRLDLGDCTNGRQSDGEWIEISTPPLTMPPSSRFTGCMRAARISLRSSVGFPIRMRSLVLVERRARRMGMTLGPYADGSPFRGGTLVHHSFRVGMSKGAENQDGAEYATVFDEVRLQTDCEDDLDGTAWNCLLCWMLRLLLRIFKQTLFIRCHRTDMASYMDQTVSSLERLRRLVERGWGLAEFSARDSSIVDKDDRQGGDDRYAPLLGTMRG